MMKLKLIEGCTADSFTIDGKDVDEVSDDQLRIILNAAILNADRLTMVVLLQDYVRDNGSLSVGETCEQCGDNVYTYEVEL